METLYSLQTALNLEVSESAGALFCMFPLREVDFTKEFVGSGGFAEVYKAYHSSGKPLALKVFSYTKPHMRNTTHSTWEMTIEDIKRRLAQNECLFSQEFFTTPQFIPAGNDTWYIMDYFEGKSVKKALISSEKEPDEEDVGRALKFYADVLSFTHSKGFIINDNAWSNVLMSNKEFRVCDLDFILKQNVWPYIQTYHKEYGSQEHYRDTELTAVSDLESFALMTHHLITGQTFIGPLASSTERDRENARNNRRAYKVPSNFPKNLSQVVAPLLNYPRNKTITIEDFKRAINQDYKL